MVFNIQGMVGSSTFRGWWGLQHSGDGRVLEHSGDGRVFNIQGMVGSSTFRGWWGLQHSGDGGVFNIWKMMRIV